MKKIIWVSLCLLLSLTAYSAFAQEPPDTSTPDPTAPDAQMDEWANLYPGQYAEWKDSVHGAAYLAGNTDAPACADCHEDPASEAFDSAALHYNIPANCATCHADESLMSKYGIPADVYDTYRADYHGATVEYYRATNTVAMRHEAVCSDCHASHAIYRVDDARSPAAPENLIVTCQKCHAEASPAFAEGSTGHLRTTHEESAVLFFISLFYKILIPVVIGLMLIYIVLDVLHRLRNKNKREES